MLQEDAKNQILKKQEEKKRQFDNIIKKKHQVMLVGDYNAMKQTQFLRVKTKMKILRYLESCKN